MFASAQLERIARALRGMARPVAMHLCPGSDPEDALGRALGRAVGQISQVGGDRLPLEVRPPEQGGDLPWVQVENVRYRAVPMGAELDPFLELLVSLSRRPPPRTEAYRVSARAADAIGADPEIGAPDGLDLGASDGDGDSIGPAELRVLVAPTCPVCPGVVGTVNRIAVRDARVRVEVVDVQYYAEEAGGVQAVPAVVIDGERTVVGPVEETSLVAMLAARDSEAYVEESLASMVRSGRVREAAALLARPAGQRALGALFPRGTMQERIGLMLAVEEALARDAHALDGAVQGLLRLLERPDPVLRGDTADLLGRIGSPAARDALERLASDADPDVREVALESLAALRTPS